MDRMISGIAASPGFAVGEAHLLHRGEILVEERKLEPDEVEAEVRRFESSLEKAREEIEALQEKITNTMGEEGARIFGVHQMILHDPMVVEATKEGIRQSLRNAGAVFDEIMGGMRDTLSEAADEYLAQRSLDIEDVRRRVLMQLAPGGRLLLRDLRRPVVVVAEELTPSETAHLDPEKVLAFVTEAGGRTSHAAIMARSLGVPAVAGVSRITERVRTGSLIAVDGTSGQVAVNPDEYMIKFFESQKAIFAELERELLKLKNLPAVTLDGREVELSANIEFPEGVESALNYGARGIGLLRTEYLYLGCEELPSEDKQYSDYLKMVEQVAPDSVIIRTFDLGGDKVGVVPATPLERNPFLGWRAIRVSLAHPKVFMNQLRAILRTSAHGPVKLIFPMISGLEELMQAKEILNQAKESLSREGMPFDEDLPVGIMMEIPAACAMADILAAEADFLSIGTNDLIQYSLAVDRGNAQVAYLYQELHPAILRQVKMVIDAGHRHGKWVGMCGEMSANPLATMILIGMGLDELSMSPELLPEIKKVIRSCTHAEAKACADDALNQNTVEGVTGVARRYTEGKLGELVTDVGEGAAVYPPLLQTTEEEKEDA
ncbi:MAG: phosphoenolpyruvate--protein phosphotransferase [Candidatus Latescibacteria bacterium]|nr:phosphoenolpyruvate--protein phosphotransferase [Candidatus Latescibacterota bacterium]